MHAVHFWGQERGLPVGRECPTSDGKKSKRKGKSIGPRMNYGHAYHIVSNNDNIQVEDYNAAMAYILRIDYPELIRILPPFNSLAYTKVTLYPSLSLNKLFNFSYCM